MANIQRYCDFYTPGLVPYEVAWNWQRSLVAACKQDPTHNDVLILLQHPPIYTLGQGATPEFLKFDPAIAPHPVLRIERGGEVTYHAPGQLVGYPILNLAFHQKDLHWYLRQLEEVIIQTLASYGVQGDRVPGLTGVWVQGYKVAAIGIKVSQWITMHGFALNVCPDMSGFQHIVPCGIADKPVGRLQQFIPDLELADVQARLAIAFATVFQLTLLPTPVPNWETISTDFQ